MDKRELQLSMYELRGASTAQRRAMAVVVGIWVLAAWWMLAGGGLAMLGTQIGWARQQGDAARRICLAAGFSIYYLRILLTEFVFLKRGVSWKESLSIAVWLLFIFSLLGIAGATNEAAFGATGITGVVLFVFGSWINLYSEYARYAWKSRPENAGRLFTGSFFRYTRHPNYLGDLLLFSGLCVISGGWITILVPVLMLAGFVFVNIPVLDAHLHEHYGSAFDEYAQRTRKLVPFVY